MKSLSYWGRHNSRKARFIIAISHILLIINALLLGFLSFHHGIIFPKWVLIALPILFFGVYLFYPFKGIRAGIFKQSWFRQKAHDVILVFLYVLIITLGFNRFVSVPIIMNHTSDLPSAQFIVHKSSPENNTKGTGGGIWQTLKELKKEIKNEIAVLKEAFKNKRKSKWSTGLEILLIMASLIVAIGLIYLIGALACSLSCSGMEGLAVVVLVLGWGGTILLTILAIRKILKKTRIEKQNALEDKPQVE